MKKLILILAVLAFASCASSNGCREFEGLSFQSRVLGRDVPYSVILPEDYHRSDKSYPVLYFFHCIGGDSTTGIQYMELAGEMDRLVREGQMSPMIIVMPDIYMSYAADAYDGSFPYETFLMDELVPSVDTLYRTDGNRFTMGCSMGGFAAMQVALRNRDRFCGFAALSPSLRTDEQYASEWPQLEWDRQWGRNFGGVGLRGKDRLTEHYLSYSPLHLLETIPAPSLQDFGMFITVGNGEEGSLAESNERAHMILAERGLEHEWSVREGQHDFAFWRSVAPDALRYASGCCGGREYVAKAVREPGRSPADRSLRYAGNGLWLPADGGRTTRLYPCVYVFGASGKEQNDILEYYSFMKISGRMDPLAFRFVADDEDYAGVLAEGGERLRDSQRMRSALCFGPAVPRLQALMMAENYFTNVVFVEPAEMTDPDEFARVISAQNRYPKIIIAQRSAPDASMLKIALKRNGLTHYHFCYSADPVLYHLPDWLTVIDFKFHD